MLNNRNSLAATSALTAVENKIPNISNLVKKTDSDAEISDIEKKNILAHLNITNLHMIYLMQR